MDKLFDILPGLNGGDSYGAQACLNAAPESLRWVPTAGGITASLTLQVNQVCLALNTAKVLRNAWNFTRSEYDWIRV